MEQEEFLVLRMFHQQTNPKSSQQSKHSLVPEVLDLKAQLTLIEPRLAQTTRRARAQQWCLRKTWSSLQSRPYNRHCLLRRTSSRTTTPSGTSSLLSLSLQTSLL